MGEMGASGANSDPHTVGGLNQGGGTGAGFNKWWGNWPDIHQMNAMCNNNGPWEILVQFSAPCLEAPHRYHSVTLTIAPISDFTFSQHDQVGPKDCRCAFGPPGVGDAL